MFYQMGGKLFEILKKIFFEKKFPKKIKMFFFQKNKVLVYRGKQLFFVKN